MKIKMPARLQLAAVDASVDVGVEFRCGACLGKTMGLGAGIHLSASLQTHRTLNIEYRQTEAGKTVRYASSASLLRYCVPGFWPIQRTRGSQNEYPVDSVNASEVECLARPGGVSALFDSAQLPSTFLPQVLLFPVTVGNAATKNQRLI